MAELRVEITTMGNILTELTAAPSFSRDPLHGHLLHLPVHSPGSGQAGRPPPEVKPPSEARQPLRVHRASGHMDCDA